MAGNAGGYSSSRQYVNTMVFAIIAGIVSLMLLALVWRASEAVQPYSAFIITVEVGLILIIVGAIARIILYERQAYLQARNGTNNLLRVNTCPDYWTRNNDMCVSAFQTEGGEQPPYVYYMGQDGRGGGEPQVHSLNLADYNDLSIADVCAKISGGSDGSGGGLQSPWTDVKAVCDSYNA